MATIAASLADAPAARANNCRTSQSVITADAKSAGPHDAGTGSPSATGGDDSASPFSQLITTDIGRRKVPVAGHVREIRETEPTFSLAV